MLKGIEKKGMVEVTGYMLGNANDNVLFTPFANQAGTGNTLLCEKGRVVKEMYKIQRGRKTLQEMMV